MQHLDWIKAEGTVIYDPHGRSAKSRHIVSEPWWVLLLCDNEIPSYYNYWLKKRGVYIEKYSLYGSHVSLVKGEKIVNKNIWKKHHKKKVVFEYSHTIFDNGKHWWLLAKSPFFAQIRTELGLSPKPYNFNFHLTVGRKV